ncbi:hypothetical protein [Dyella sedimenti]|jgi:hypothetical protein|uniref:hypothetical protein n=1 Tax=Dyella sedimenti TaxID=2919947 RepID=UPI001FAA66DB|nr:hypothetical protein [Dyella sedimenti]
MTRFSTLLARAAAAILLGSMLVLAGCHRGSTKDQVRTADMKNQFDTVLQAYKNGQFIVDGAVLSALDTGSHFAYLKDQGRLPKTVLLERSDDSKIRKQHLQYMARLQLDYGFTVYYDDGGTLKKISVVDTKARDLEDYKATPKAEAPPPQQHY